MRQFHNAQQCKNSRYKQTSWGITIKPRQTIEKLDVNDETRWVSFNDQMRMTEKYVIMIPSNQMNMPEYLDFEIW